MNKTLKMCLMILFSVVVTGCIGLFSLSLLRSPVVQGLFIVFLVALVFFVIYGSILEYKGVPTMRGSVRYESAKAVLLFWEDFEASEVGPTEYIICRRRHADGEYVEVGRTNAYTFTDRTADVTVVNSYQVYGGIQALEKRSRRRTHILTLQPLSK